MTVQPLDRLVDVLVQAVRADPHVKAAWLGGSVGRGQGDRHSDIDLHLWLRPEDAPGFRAGLKDWLANIYPVLLHHELFGGQMVVCLLQAEAGRIMALDLFIETDEPKLTAGRVRLLWDRGGQLAPVPPVLPTTEALRRTLNVEISYFWRLYAMLPGLHRGELIPAVQRFGQLAAQLVNVCTLGRGRPRDVGDQRANELLTPEEQVEIERALALPEVSRAMLIRAHSEVADLMRLWGRLAAQQLGAAYPEDLEQAVLAHVQRELEQTAGH